MARKDKKDPSARKFSQMIYKGSQSLMRMWPYEKTEVLGDKGPLIDRPFDLGAGNTLTLFIDMKRIKEDAGRDKPCLPPNTTNIPAFTLCELTLAPKSNQAEEKGSCVKIAMVRFTSYSLYSLWSTLSVLPHSLQEARTQQLEHAACFSNIHKDLETRDVPFWLHVDKCAQLDESGVEPQLVNWSEGADPIVLPAALLLKYTNTTRLDWAVALLNVAIVCNALHVLVFSSDFWTRDGSIYKGLPLIDTEHLLECAEPGRNVETRYTTVVDGEEFTVFINVESEMHIVQSGPELTTPDFVLAGLETELAQGHPISFSLVNSGRTVSSVWKGFVNASRGDGLKRKRLSSMLE
jgi:hypothetical protein